LLADIENSKKKWKHSIKFEREVKEIINKLYLVAKKNSDLRKINSRSRPNLLPPIMLPFSITI